MTEVDRDVLGPPIGKIPSGVFVASCGRGEKSVPFIASWVQQVAMDPPALCIAIDASRSGLEVLSGDDSWITLSMLPEGRFELMKPFFKAPEEGESAFGPLATSTAPNGGIYLDDALCWMECKELSRMQVGGHHLLAIEVRDAKLLQPDASPMVHIRKTGFSY